VSNSGSPRWTHRRVRDVLKTARAIAGDWSYETSAGTFTIPIPAIVTQQRLEQLRDRLTATSTGANATTRKHSFLLARRATSECGNPMHCYCRPDGTGRVYRCSMSTADRGPDRCDCRRASADAIEDAAWDLVAHELTDPERLQQLAGLAATSRHINDPEEDIGDVRALDRKIKRLETAIGSQIAELLAAGTDPAAIREAAHQLERQLETLRSQRATALRWAAARADQTAQLDRINRLAASARAALSNPAPELKARIVGLLDLRVTVVGHNTCATCYGKGLLADSPDHPEHRRRKTGTICPTCNRYRTIPVIELHGLLPDADRLPDHPDTEGFPFTLRSIA
jgi:hypothetical protein